MRIRVTLRNMLRIRIKSRIRIRIRNGIRSRSRVRIIIRIRIRMRIRIRIRLRFRGRSWMPVQRCSCFFLVCRGSHPAGSAGKLRRLLLGRLPHQESAWPEVRHEHDEVVVPVRLIYSSGSFA